MPTDCPAEPWLSFLRELDGTLDAPVDLHCIGGFVVSQHFGFARETADLDVLTVLPKGFEGRILRSAGKGSALHARHRVYIDRVRVANYPADYEDRLNRAFPIWPNVRLWALEPHDLD